MKLCDIVSRNPAPEPWAEGEGIPWSDPDFSRRMLREHLSQAHDRASRRSATIDEHVRWIHEVILSGRPARILDLACGPGLYSSRLAGLGHDCTGIDFGPASIQHATEQAEREGLRCTYLRNDLRAAEYGAGHALALLISGELNVFRRADARRILGKARDALKPEGILLLEPHTFDAVEAMGRGAPTWYAAPHGLFSDDPHLCLSESHWDAEAAAATQRYFIVDAASGCVTRHALSTQAYTEEDYRSLLREAGFEQVELYPSLTGGSQEAEPGLIAITARRAPS